MLNDEQLADVLSEFARTMVTDYAIAPILDHLVERIVDLLPVTGAGVTLAAPGANPCYVAVSDDASATFTFPLRADGRNLGALDLYNDTAGPLDAATIEVATILADVAAGYLAHAQARADLRSASDQSREQALHDDLTGLANRDMLLRRLECAVVQARAERHTVGVIVAGIDGFEAVNDRHGYATGDALLVEAARRLDALAGESHTLARISGDEFVILCDKIDEPAGVEAVAAAVAAAFSKPFALDGEEIAVTASVGLAYSGMTDCHPEMLLHDANSAMRQMKHDGVALFDSLDRPERRFGIDQSNLERDLRGAAARGELRAEYQPIVNTLDGRVTGVEALVRWQHPTRGLVLPGLLIPLAERSSDIIELGQWILREACLDLRRWQATGTAGDFTISINVSAHELMSHGYPRSVADILDATGTEPERVALEMTETAFLYDSERAMVVLTALKDIGVKLALDDIGTGYSSLSYLKRYPIDIVKIDREFVSDIQHEDTSAAIVAALVALAHELSMSVVAEGVEDGGALDRLMGLGCDACQGYYFARPMPADAIEALLRPSVGATFLPAAYAALPRLSDSMKVLS